MTVQRKFMLPGYRAKKPARDSNPESPDDSALLDAYVARN
jgi:hypothetical protein